MRIDDSGSVDGDLVVQEQDRPSWIASRAVFSICSHIIELEQQMGNGINIDSTTAESFLKRLQKWNETLPTELRHFATIKDTSLGSAERELFIGATHVACTYYFTIILVTRPFLISHLVSRIRRRRQQSRRLGNEQAQSPDVSDLAQACLDSAVYMAKAGYTAVSSQILSNNMRIIKYVPHSYSSLTDLPSHHVFTPLLTISLKGLDVCRRSSAWLLHVCRRRA